jgi:hypothetical protein
MMNNMFGGCEAAPAEYAFPNTNNPTSKAKRIGRFGFVSLAWPRDHGEKGPIIRFITSSVANSRASF